MDRSARPAEAPDNRWWAIVKTTDDGVHLYELGYAVPTPILDEEGKDTGHRADMALTEERHAQINADHPGTILEFSMAPGRPNKYLNPKRYTEGPQGERVLAPLSALPGVTLHLHSSSQEA